MTARFHSRDDVSDEAMERVLGFCLTLDELQTARQDGRVLQYCTSDQASEVIARWEDEGFSIDEFESFCFSATILGE